jgi:hypothetical protein
VAGRQHGEMIEAKGLNDEAQKTGVEERYFSECQKDLGPLSQMSWGMIFKKELVDEGKPLNAAGCHSSIIIIRSCS